MKSLILTLSLLGALFLNGARAQSPDPEDLRQFNFQIISLNDSIRDAYYFSDGDYKPVFVTNNNFTQLYRYNGPKPLALYRQVQRAEGPGYEPFAVWPGSNGAREGRHYMLLVSQTEETYKISSFDHTENAGKKNLALFFNATNEPMKVYARGLEFDLADFSSEAIVMPVDERGLFEAAIVTKSGLVFRGRLKMPLGEQGMYFVRPSRVSNNQVAIKRIRNPRRVPGAE
ncbi:MULTISPECIES: hypothetical protein [unclassified Lentimonas]|uniref:hypothetical protein n=1 Tax=unclassified Lentimonas TaxID=2630993 RepID=UPI00132599DF|nr:MULTISPECIES: hypothetical protein [unclassified Lentimonas]CAA6679361.1 Unannotated [Lentimonas sp. CC4]CAA6687360.1 Unannotated [Lentimonas sp. CC6]CAA7078032.1 Unannotated [Lentimonas sp. CC4]CAA7168002.1 Unannotated [Lentimonas sp. CC21]CAA7179577.1 Unannotated [Lentimonas sp. CC8]